MRKENQVNNEKVSILILMDLPLKLFFRIIKEIENGVSILILMDLPLKLWTGLLGALLPVGFNPYFNGLTS